MQRLGRIRKGFGRESERESGKNPGENNGDRTLPVLIIIAVAIPTGYVAGNAAVYAFNRIPATWLVDYDEIPDEKAVSEGKQRVRVFLGNMSLRQVSS